MLHKEGGRGQFPLWMAEKRLSEISMCQAGLGVGKENF
jgi:hypothetical protein